MKKILIAIMMLIATSSVAFAAANPFSDVPRDHWSYDAVQQLADDGIIEGYGDSTYRGDRLMTRYEMAQATARAIANADAKHQVIIDKLSAEFSEELNNLGVRVSNLEKHADMVKWNGKVRYTYRSERFNGIKLNDNQLLLRLEPSIEINDNFTAHVRLDAYHNMKEDYDKEHENKVILQHVYVNGNFGKVNASLGKMPVNNSIIFNNDEDSFSGVKVGVLGKNSVELGAGRYSGKYADNLYFNGNGDTANYQFIQYKHNTGKFVGGAEFQALKSKNLESFAYTKNANKNHARVWGVNAKYAFDKNVAFSAVYSKNTSADYRNNAWQLQLDYKGINPERKNSYGVYAAYRNLGENTVFGSHFDAMRAGQKGFEVGAKYVPFKNVITSIKYFKGKNDSALNRNNAKTLFGRIEFLF